MPHISWETTESWTREALQAAGFTPSHAEAAAWGLCEAEAAGISTHGVIRTLQYSQSARDGHVDVVTEPEWINQVGTTSLIDAHGGYGYLATKLLVDHLSEVVSQHGIVSGGVRNSHHFGATALYAVRAARRGHAAIVMTNSSANLAGPGAKRAVMGNNPLAIALPGPKDQGPVCADIAMSVVAQGNIRMASRLGEKIPLGWARDASGEPTTDPDVALETAMLEPIGGHKGFVLATMIELLAGAMTGSPFGAASSAHTNPMGGVGHFLVVMDPTRYSTAEHMLAAVESLAEQVSEAADRAPEATLPGWREEARRRLALDTGIPFDDAVLERLSALDPVVGWSLRSGIPG